MLYDNLIEWLGVQNALEIRMQKIYMILVVLLPSPSTKLTITQDRTVKKVRNQEFGLDKIFPKI